MKDSNNKSYHKRSMKDKEDALPTLSSLRLDGLFNKREKRNGCFVTLYIERKKERKKGKERKKEGK